MSVKKPVKTVFLSSVARGLEEYRDAVYAAIERLDGYHCVRMEDFGARELESARFCAQRAAECDVFVGLVGQRYGSNPPDDDRSLTEIEFDAANGVGKPCLIFAAHEEFAVPANLIESEDKRARLKAFRDRVMGRPAGIFQGDEKDLALLVVEALHNLRAEFISSRKIIPDPGGKTYLLFPWRAKSASFCAMPKRCLSPTCWSNSAPNNSASASRTALLTPAGRDALRSAGRQIEPHWRRLDLTVVGYTDDLPIIFHVRFSDNEALATARADAANLADTSRVRLRSRPRPAVTARAPPAAAPRWVGWF